MKQRRFRVITLQGAREKSSILISHFGCTNIILANMQGGFEIRGWRQSNKLHERESNIMVWPETSQTYFLHIFLLVNC